MSAEDIIVWGDRSADANREREDEPIIIWNTRDPLGGKTRENFERELRENLAGRVREAWIFGSYCTDKFGRDSDVDLFLVVETDKQFLDRALDFSDILDLIPSMDLLVYTPHEFRELTGDPSPGFWSSAVASMRRIL